MDDSGPLPCCASYFGACEPGNRNPRSYAIQSRLVWLCGDPAMTALTHRRPASAAEWRHDRDWRAEMKAKRARGEKLDRIC